MPATLRICLATFVVSLSLYACSGGGDSAAVAFPDSLVDDEEIVLVNSNPVTGRDLRVFAMVYQPTAPDSLKSRMFNLQLLNGYIDRALLLQEARAGGISVDDSTTQWFVQQFLASMGGANQVYANLSRTGITPSDLEDTIRRDLTVRAFIEGPVSDDITISEEDARAFYEANQDRFAAQDSVHARHIILRGSQEDTEEDIQAKRDKLEELRKRAAAGEDFSKLARENSEGPSAPNGGDLGYFTAREMVEPFSNAAFALEPGQVSGVVETSFGYHIIKVEDRKTGEEVPFDEIRDQIVEMLRQRRLNDELEIRLKRNRSVAIIEPKFDYGGLTQRESATFTR